MADVWPYDLVTLILVLRIERKIVWKENEINLESIAFSFDTSLLPSPFTFLIFVSGTYFKVKLNLDKYNVQQACLLSQIRYSLVVILELNNVSEVQYKDMMIDRWWKVLIGIINIIKSEG